MSFTDQKPRVVTTDDLAAHWSGYKDGSHFRCYLCGHKFKLGDTWRWVYDNDGDGAHAGNFMVCSDCDGEGVQKMTAAGLIEQQSVRIPGLSGEWTQVEAKYDYHKDKCRCPNCGGLGVPWRGWFTCYDCDCRALVSDGRSFVR